MTRALNRPATPIHALFAEWLRLYDAANAATTDEESEATYQRRRALELQITSTPTRALADVRAKARLLQKQMGEKWYLGQKLIDSIVTSLGHLTHNEPEPILALAERRAEAIKACDGHGHDGETIDRLADAVTAIDLEIAATPATTLAGALVKLRIYFDMMGIRGQTIDARVAGSALADLERLARGVP